MVLSEQPNDICILRLSAIGDVCHAVSAVQAIQAYYPKASITWVIGKVEAALLDGLPGVKFVIFDKKQGKIAYQQLRKAFKNKQFDVLLHMQVALRANLAARCIPAKVKIGFDWHRAKEAHSLFIILPSCLAFFNRNTCRTARFIPSLEKIITANRNYSSLFCYDDLILDLLILKIKL